MPSTDVRRRLKQAIEAKKMRRTNKDTLMNKINETGMMDQVNSFVNHQQNLQQLQDNETERRKMRKEMVTKLQPAKENSNLLHRLFVRL